MFNEVIKVRGKYENNISKKMKMIKFQETCRDKMFKENEGQQI
jgi:hypothetical protein